MTRTTSTLEKSVDFFLNGPARYTLRHHFSDWQALLFVLSILVAELVSIYVIVYGLITIFENSPAIISALLRLAGAGEQDVQQTFLELTFPADTTKSAFATEQLHVLLSGIPKYHGTLDTLAARKKPYSYEIYAVHPNLLNPIRSLFRYNHG